MKRILAFALCAAFACQAGARTLYVDATRPNNNGNGLKAKTAKKTIQAAVNAAKDGDTIVVLQGAYAPIKTKNRKIAIKSKSGADKTTITHKGSSDAIAILGKVWSEQRSYATVGGTYVFTWKSTPESKGTSTKLVGFTLNGRECYGVVPVSGGTVQSCIIQNGDSDIGLTCWSKLKLCTIQNNDTTFFKNSSFDRCKFLSNHGYASCRSTSSKFSNCLFAHNEMLPLTGCTLVNCTVADNQAFAMNKTKAYNTVFDGVGAAQFKAAKKNSFTNCYKGASQFAPFSSYRPAEGSRLIDKGKVSAALAKLYGAKDLVGNKRVKGKSVDIGCYEY